MSEFEKYIADKNSVWGKRRNNQGGRQLDPTEIAEMLNELERVKQERDVATKSAERLAANCELLESQRNLAESERRVLQYKLADANEGRAQAESECDAAQQSRARLVGAIRRWREIDRAFEKRSLMQVLDDNKTLSAKLKVLTEERNLLLNAVQGQMGKDLREWQENARKPKTRQPKTRHICVWISPRHIVNHSKIFLDGVDVTHFCFAADEKSGTAWCYKKDVDGKFVLGNYGKPETEVLRGKVEIVFDPSFTTGATNGWVSVASVGRAEL